MAWTSWWGSRSRLRHGQRAPHAWLRRDGARISTLDLFDGRLTVLTGPRGGPWRGAATELAADGLPIVALSADRDLHDEDGAFARHYRLGDSGAALVRPDGYLAWRRLGPGGDGRLLGLPWAGPSRHRGHPAQAG